MRAKSAILAFLMLSIIATSSSGCIGLVPAREFMEDLRDDPSLEEVEERINASHVFATNIEDIQGSTEYYSTQDFVVDENVVEISAYISTQMPLELIIPGIPTEARYVSASLTDADNQVVWQAEITETERKMVETFTQPLAQGDWTLTVEARGYGEEIANLYKDSFQVLIKIERQCWKYPNENICSYD